MKFSTKEDIDAPIDAVFDMLCDFESLERLAVRRGIEVQRADTLAVPGLGMKWNAAFDLRGKRRQVAIEVVTFDRPNEIVLESTSANLVGLMDMELVALARNRTRVVVALELRPLTLSARLLLQSMKLTKTKLTEKYRAKVADYARELEQRHEKTTSA